MSVNIPPDTESSLLFSTHLHTLTMDQPATLMLALTGLFSDLEGGGDLLSYFYVSNCKVFYLQFRSYLC